MRNLIAVSFLMLFAVHVQAVEPLKCDLNPALYTPGVTYYDAGSQQNFYYDQATSQFLVFQRTGATTTTGGTLVSYSDDQTLCQLKANFLASTFSFGHGPNNTWIGAFEGLGWGSTPDCATCVPGFNMTLTGDAAAMRSDGTYVRVRSWR